MATSRRSAGARPSAGAGTTRRPSSRTSRPGSRTGRGVARQRTSGDAPAAAGSASSRGTGGAKTGRAEKAGRPSGPPQRVPGRPSITGRAAVLALVFAVLLVSYAYPLRTWFEQCAERADLERESEQLEASVERLERELRLWEDPAYVAAVARERLGFVMPGEQGYVVVPDPDATGEPVVDEAGLPPVGEGEWYERLWTSVQVADSDPAADPTAGAADS